MIPIEQVKKLKPGTILFRLDGQPDDLAILKTAPVQRFTANRVYFEERSTATGWSDFRSCQVIAEDFFLSEKDAFLEAINRMRTSQVDLQIRVKATINRIHLAEQAAKKKGW